MKFHARFSSGFVPSVYLCEMVCVATKIAEVCIVLPLVHSRRTFNPQKSTKSLLNLNKNGQPIVVLGERRSDLVDINLAN